VGGFGQEVQAANPAAAQLKTVMFLYAIEIYFILTYQREGREMKTFSDKVYDLLRKVPKGRVTTYKEIAHALETRAYRGVGQAMKRNPYAPEVP
jgi:O6-methylguanine-DNA--protein-cysteine methyltransferase